MVKNSFVLFVILFSLIQCTTKGSMNKTKESEISFSKIWKLDSLGCLGARQKIASDSLDVIKLFIGSSKETFIKAFGYPNSIKNNGSEQIIFYSISCSKPIPVKGDAALKNAEHKNIESTLLKVEINREGIVKSASIILP
jgi:hypothetical protein